MPVGGLTQSVQGFAGLPGVAGEVRTLTTLFPAVVYGRTFELSTIECSYPTPILVAHLETHGDQLRSSPLLRPHVRLPSDHGCVAFRAGPSQPTSRLAVLSACRTAAGDDRAALGLAGVAGRPAPQRTRVALVHQRRRNREPDEQLLSQSEQGQGTKAQSLQQAQIALLRSEQLHPSYRAPFLLIGSWQ